MIETRRTTCNRDCPDACGILADVDDGRVTRLRGDPEHPVTQGFLCYRTNHFLSRQYAPDRLTTPLLKRGGSFVAISWDEALDLAAKKLLEVRAESGPAAIFPYRSGGSLGYLKILNDYFFEKLGPCTMQRGDICTGALEHAQHADFGELDSNDLFELENARSVVLWGKNPYTSSPHLIPILKRAQAKGARLTLIDPIHHRTAGLCDRYVQLRPGGDFSLALAAARLLDDEGRLPPDAHEWCEDLDGWRALVHTKSAAEHARDAGVTLDDVAHLGRALTEGAPCTILVGWGMARRANGSAIVRAVDALGAVTGNIGVPGAGVSYYFARKKAADFASLVDGARVAPRTLCEPLLGRELLAAKDPPVRLLWVTCGNPVVMLPESETTRRAIEQTEFVVVADSWISDTARLATLVLPVTTLLEEDDVLGSYGHHYLGVSQPVAARPEGVKSDLEIFQALAPRVGLGDLLAGTPREWKRRLVEQKLAPHGVTLELLEENGYVRSPLSPRIAFEGRRFSTPSGKARLITAADLPPAGDDDADERYPLALLSLSTPESQCSQWVAPFDGPVDATVHPDAANGVPDGALATLESARASLTVRVRHDDKQRRDIALLPKGGSLLKGQCANALVEARLSDGGEGGAIHGQRVRLVAVTAALLSLLALGAGCDPAALFPPPADAGSAVVEEDAGVGSDDGACDELAAMGDDDKERVVLIGSSTQGYGGVETVHKLRAATLHPSDGLADDGSVLALSFRPARIEFVPSGRFALIAGEEGQVASLAVQSAASLALVDELVVAEAGASDLRIARDGTRAFVVVSNVTPETSGIHVIDIGCDGSLTLVDGAYFGLRLSDSLVFLPGEERAVLLGGQTQFEPYDDDDVRLLGWDGSSFTQLGAFDLYGEFIDSLRIGVSPDGSTLVIPNGSAFSDEGHTAIVAFIDDEGVTESHRVDGLEDAREALFSPDGQTVLISQTMANRVSVLSDEGEGLALTGAVTGIGLAEQMALVARGSLSGTVLVTSVDVDGTANIARLSIRAPGVVDDEGQLALPEGLDNLPRALAVQP